MLSERSFNRTFFPFEFINALLAGVRNCTLCHLAPKLCIRGNLETSFSTEHRQRTPKEAFWSYAWVTAHLVNIGCGLKSCWVLRYFSLSL